MSDRVDGFAERLRELRLRMGMTQEEMAAKGKVSRVALSYYENGQRTPDIAFLKNIVHHTGCGYEYLMGEEILDEKMIKCLIINEISPEMKLARMYLRNALDVLGKVDASK